MLIGINCQCGREFDVSENVEIVRCPSCKRPHWIEGGPRYEKNREPAASQEWKEIRYSWGTNPIVDDTGVRYCHEALTLTFCEETGQYQINFWGAGDPNEGRHWWSQHSSQRRPEWNKSSDDLKTALKNYLALAERYAPVEMLPEIRKRIEPSGGRNDG